MRWGRLPTECCESCEPVLQPERAEHGVLPGFQSCVLPYDLTRGGTRFAFNGHTDVKELGFIFEDTITKGKWKSESWATRRYLQRA